MSSRIAGSLAAVLAVTVLVAGPTAARPAFLPDTDGATVLLLPGTGDRDGADQIGRTVDVGWFGDASVENGRVVVIDYPAAFGARIFGVLIPIVETGTYNESATIGTANLVAAANEHQGPVVLNGFSQSATPVMSAAYLLHQSGTKPDSDIQVIIGSDPRFPKTGAEVVLPSIIPGLYTNGERDPAGTGGIAVTSICVIGDQTCGMANPLADPVGFLVYFVPGFYIHGNMYQHAGEWEVVSEKKSADGNTTFVVLDGGNPWGMVLREFGVPVPKEFDEAMNFLVPRQMPGEASTVFGHEVPTPRQLQAAFYRSVGLTMPVTDPDVTKQPGPAEWAPHPRRVGTSPAPSGHLNPAEWAPQTRRVGTSPAPSGRPKPAEWAPRYGRAGTPPSSWGRPRVPWASAGTESAPGTGAPSPNGGRTGYSRWQPPRAWSPGPPAVSSPSHGAPDSSTSSAAH
ncbi:PE-PPE domain-containing protein [Gordonia araii]|uniref:PE-PPE domain-containing protein n=1 Tax=Gordonia araii TaxID=263909 RepID=UPI0014788306|nr:PE-PPE domain-containing protein [Gordonia araii]NNG96052.1 PE-PPE domain-containing protein [Gordonia araii NBRC 100433]